MGRLRLRPYRPDDAAVITSWITDEYSFRQWSADRFERYPLTPQEMNRYYDETQADGRSWGVTAVDESGAVGHCIMRFPGAGQEEIRFGFVIVDRRKRNRGYGRALLRLALQDAFERLRVQRVSLAVFENNPAALHCYLACGFRVVENAPTECYRCLDEVWNCLQLEMTKAQWEAIMSRSQEDKGDRL